MLSRSRRLLREREISPRQAAIAAMAFGVSIVLVVSVVVVLWSRSSPPRAALPALEHVPSAASLEPPSPPPTRRAVFTPRGASRAGSGSGSGSAAARSGSESVSSGGGWFGPAGVAVALALVGWGSVASRRYLIKGVATGPASVPVRVVGRASLSPKHAVYLVEVGDRVLILGAGPQGAPALLGELDDPARPSASPRFDHRLGDEA